jgi:hypothetical protein
MQLTSLPNKHSGHQERSDRKRSGQPGHPGSGTELLPVERVEGVIEPSVMIQSLYSIR